MEKEIVRLTMEEAVGGERSTWNKENRIIVRGYEHWWLEYIGNKNVAKRFNYDTLTFEALGNFK